MREITLTTDAATTVVAFYASADELPAARYVRWQQALVLAGEVGSDTGSLADRLAQFVDRAQAGRFDEALEIAAHAYGTLQLLLSGERLPLAAFAVLVTTINGALIDDVTDDGLKATAQRLADAGLTEAVLQQVLADVKKKVRTELEHSHPQRFHDVNEMTFAAAFKRKLLADLVVLADPSDATRAAQQAATNELLDAQPVAWLAPGHPDHPLEGLDQWFESTCAVLEQHGVTQPERLPINRFFHRLAYLEQQFAAQASA